ncbi:VWA domain-containing protein [Tersicoccus sp. MR15.9]|uniref:vWA domain-containing protein n=1 Tax=Tersicoccus mangrovi TaxID=3121635 RepID=UPI002FE65E99
MALIQWWMLFLVPVVLGVVVWLLARHRRRRAAAVPVAHSERLTALPGWAAALRRYRITLAAGLALVLGLIVVLGVAAARPASTSALDPQKKNRDIILCMDVSGSMLSFNAEVVDVFERLARGFNGERIGMVIFNSSAVQVFPLTDDYDFVAEQLATAGKAFDFSSSDIEFFAGTFTGSGSSLIGDGLATCVNSFDQKGQPRTRSIVLSTDNRLAGRPLYTITEAATLAKQAGIRVYGLNPAQFGLGTARDRASAQMQQAIESTDGDYYAIDDADAVAQIIARVQSREATALVAAPRASTGDRPNGVLVAALIGVALLLPAAWRLRR